MKTTKTSSTRITSLFNPALVNPALVNLALAVSIAGVALVGCSDDGTLKDPKDDNDSKKTEDVFRTRRALSSLVPIKNCAELETEIQSQLTSRFLANVEEEKEAALKSHAEDCEWRLANPDNGGRYYGGDSASGRDVASGAMDDANAAPEGQSESDGAPSTVSKTNNQVEGVDEADIVKVDDGKHLYILASGKLQIVKSWPAAETERIQAFAIEGEPKKMLLADKKLVVFSSLTKPQQECDWESEDGGDCYPSAYYGNSACTYGYDCELRGDGNPLKITVVDVAEPAQAKIIREIVTSASLLAARGIDTDMHAVLHYAGFTPKDIQQYVDWYSASDEIANAAAGEFDWDKYYDCGGYYYESDDSYYTPENQNCQKEQQEKYAEWSKKYNEAYCSDAAEDAIAKAFDDVVAKNKATIAAVKVADVLPSLTDSLNPGEDLFAECSNFYKAASEDGDDLVSLLSFSVLPEDTDIGVTSIVSRPGTVYASGESVYLSSRHYSTDFDYWFEGMEGEEEASTVHKFALNFGGAAGAYVGSGLVEGHVLNQFGMDEHNGALRIATSSGWVPDPNAHSQLSVLEENGGVLELIGEVDDIAPTEDIRSVRFQGDRGFVVTFKKTDPLFSFDLSEPTAPKLMGELKIPGFSTYMHLMDENTLLTIGYDADDHGSFAYFDGIQLQIVDVSDMNKPTLLHKEVIGSRGSASDAATDHLAFNYMQLNETGGQLAIPMTVCEGGDDGQFGDKLTFNGLLVYKVDLNDGFAKLGGIPHAYSNSSDYFSGCGQWWSSATTPVKRSVFMDEVVYSVSDTELKVSNRSDLDNPIASVAF